MKKRSTSSSVMAIDPSDPALILSASERKDAMRRTLSPKSSAPLDLQNLPVDPAMDAAQAHDEAIRMREAGASAAPSPGRSQ